MPHARTIARIARWAPIFVTMTSAMAFADPLTSMTLPKIAPRRNRGK